MYLSKLDLHGFKSFADETTMTFAPGVTAIVGPNGCGKSNIVDAVRWAIGEQRPTVLRSEKMENVIFNGTADRKPLGMAEVQLTIENNRGVLPTEYSEVTIGRRLFRDGKSEYLMNGTQCRLKDITDLFMDTGMGADAYSVIELKMIDELLSGSTEDRRRMFEEAAGITRYKMRRKQALRKLDNTQTDLDRIRDLTDEISTQVDRLKRQAEKAQQYKEAETELRRLELLLAQVERNRLVEKQKELQQKQAEQADAAEALQGEEEAAEKRLTDLRETLTEQEATLRERREALQEHRATVRDLESEQRLQRERLDRARRDRDRTQEALEEAAQRRASLAERAEEIDDALEDARPAREAAESNLETARRERDEATAAAEKLRERVRTHRKKAQAAEDEQSERRRTLDRLTNRRELLEEERERADRQVRSLETDAEALDTRVQEAEARRDDARDALDDARDALEAAEAEREERAFDLDDAEETLRDLERQRDAAAAEVDLLEGLVSSYDEFDDAVQFLADEGPVANLQTVADVLACDDEVRVALDAALGDLAACIVVASAEEAQQAVARLREAEAGQATFLLLDRLPAPPSSSPANGSVSATPLRNRVRTASSDYDRLADVLLRNCFLAESLGEAEAAAENLTEPARIFVPTGEWVDARGLVKGGSGTTSASPVASRLGRREQLERARDQVDELQARCREQEGVVADARAALEEADTAPYEEAVREAESALSRADQKLERVRYERESTEERRTELQERLEEIEAEMSELDDRIQRLRTEAAEGEDRVKRLRQKRAEAEDGLEEAEQREREAADAFSNVKVAAVEARNRVESLEREREQTIERIEDLDRRMKEREADLQDLQETIEEALDAQSDLDNQIDALRDERASLDETVETAETAVQTTKSTIDDVESDLRRIRKEREAATKAENQAAVRLAEIDTRLQDLIESIEEDYDRDLTDDPIAVPEDFDEAEAQSDVKSLRGRINAIGSVNPLALEEYEEEKERLDFLQEQQQDLEEAEETLMETIEEINATAAERFFETFDEIKDSFSEIFTDLFGKGASAKLQLEDRDDPLDSAIEIIAQPRGKRPVTLEQLSSGEKTLTAIALLFSIYLVKPSPFCILDEVDAPLDDANVERFMNLVRRFEDQTQFILVTHNQRTMALADRMYGVTMEEQGISKLVGVEFDEAIEMAG